MNIKNKLSLDLKEIGLEPGASLKPDLAEAERLCQTIERKDKETLLKMLRSRDQAKREWLRNFLTGELSVLLAADKYDMECHIQSQEADLEKLAKVVTRMSQVSERIGLRFQHSERALQRMEEDAQSFQDDRQQHEDELGGIDEEAQRLRQLIARKREALREKDRVV